MKSSFLSFTASIALACGASHAQLTGQISSERSSFDDVFAASHRFYPGQRVLITVEGQIDANHRYWQDRECSWFGLSCDYVNREASNLMGVSRLPLLLALEPTDVLTEPQQIYQPEWGNSQVQHLPINTSGTYDVLLGVKDADKSIDAFSTSTMLRAVIADKYDATTQIDRGQCRNRPPICSSGVYKVTVNVNNDQRLALLEKLLKTRRSASEIVNPRVMDPLFTQDKNVSRKIAAALFEHAKSFHRGDTSDARRDFLTLLSFASGLDPTHTEILNEMAATYIALGEFTKASATVKEGLDAAKAAFDKETPPRRASVVTELSKALGLRASIWVQERGAIVGTDLMVAVGLYREAASYCTNEANSAASAIDKAELYTCAKDRLVDAGRTLAMLRTRDNLILAEQLLSQAQLAARRAVDGD